MASFAAQRDELFGSGSGAKNGAPQAKTSTAKAPAAESKSAGYVPPSRGLSPQVKAQKLKEARELAEDGMKCIRKTLFKWTPDHLAAAPFFERSAAAYEVAEEADKAKLMYIQAADSQIEVSAFAAAANDLKKAAKLAVELSQYEESSHLYRRCADCWRHYGQPDKAGEYLMLGALARKDENPQQAAAQALEAVDAIILKDASADDIASVAPQALDHLKAALSLMLKLDKYEEAQDIAERLVSICAVQEYFPSMCYAMAAVTVLQLTRGDVVQADSTFMEHLKQSAYLQSKECKVSEELINAFKERDADALETVQNGYDATRLDREVVRLIKQLALTVGAKHKKRQEEKFETPAQAAREEAALADMTRELDDLLSMTQVDQDFQLDEDDGEAAEQPGQDSHQEQGQDPQLAAPTLEQPTEDGAVSETPQEVEEVEEAEEDHDDLDDDEIDLS